MSDGYGHGYDAVLTYSYYNNYYLHPNFSYRSLHKRSPITPFKPTSPFIKKATFGLLTSIMLPTNAAICAVTFCRNKKFGLVI